MPFDGVDRATARRILISNLEQTTRDWWGHLSVDPHQYRACRSIGRQLAKLDGMSAMREGYEAALARNHGAALIKLYWDGIGEWRR